MAENISYSLATISLSPAPGFSNDQPTERCFLKVTLNLGNKPLVAAEQVLKSEKFRRNDEKDSCCESDQMPVGCEKTCVWNDVMADECISSNSTMP